MSAFICLTDQVEETLCHPSNRYKDIRRIGGDIVIQMNSSWSKLPTVDLPYSDCIISSCCPRDSSHNSNFLMANSSTSPPYSKTDDNYLVDSMNVLLLVTGDLNRANLGLFFPFD